MLQNVYQYSFKKIKAINVYLQLEFITGTTFSRYNDRCKHCAKINGGSQSVLITVDSPAYSLSSRQRQLFTLYLEIHYQ